MGKVSNQTMSSKMVHFVAKLAVSSSIQYPRQTKDCHATAYVITFPVEYFHWFTKIFPKTWVVVGGGVQEANANAFA